MTRTEARSVLVVDDDLDVAQALARIVRSMGHKTRVAENGAEALAMLRESSVDLLLSDVDMPHMDGVELVARARAEKLATVRILLTASSRLDLAIRAINTGEIYRYIQKPWNHAELIEAFTQAFARIDDLKRVEDVSQASRRLEAAMQALEEEFPGITHVQREQDVYTVDERRAARALAMLPDSTLKLLMRDLGR
jgi:two-component system probable response regulator PhcQ